MNGEKYICFTASAGQIRTKKTVFIKESVYDKHKNTITCGLTLDIINEKGGVNVNKYLAYLALCNSATDVWEDFDINKSIVVEDFETEIKSVVDEICDKTYTITPNKEMMINIAHTDGCGMVLPSKSKKNYMIRLAWLKGLLVSFPYDKFIKEKSEETGKYCGIVKDIYGVEHDILKENIEVIFTKSQFKMWKYYESWDDYKEKYKKYNCKAGRCNEEQDRFRNAKLNYQMLQTLNDMSDEELKSVASITNHNIKSSGNDLDVMLKILGVTKTNTNKNHLQQALEIYPELLNDTYCKQILKQTKKSLVKKAKEGKLEVDGYYTFISPDLYAFCERLFLNIENPKGLLKDGQVYCGLFNNNQKLDCLRSPHLYREHAVRLNAIDKTKKEWFISNAVYTSCHDIISKILMFDVDGDMSLVCADKTIIQAAERNSKDIIPLYYDMKKAPSTIIDNKTIYNGLSTAYSGGNIGVIANDITKIWNSDNINLDAIKFLCMESNFTIDYAKTLYKPKRPREINKIITNYTKAKTPHFFIYAKDKTKDKVEKINNSVVNRLDKLIKNPKINFDRVIGGAFDYKILMNDCNIELNQIIIDKYTELDLKKHFLIDTNKDDKNNNIVYLYQDIRKQLIEIHNDPEDVADVLIKYLYKHKKSSFKTTLWECFGDIIVENIKKNLSDKIIKCEKCSCLIKKSNNRQMYCEECWSDKEKEDNKRYARESMRKKRNVKGLENPYKPLL